MATEKKELVKEFHEYVNMSVKELEKWLDDPKSQETGQADSDGEPKGHKSGRHIVELLKKKESDWTDDDYTQVKHVSAYCKRHLKQGPSKDVEDSKWRYSLLNWGHDPLKTKRERSRSPAKSPRGKATPERTPEKEGARKTPPPAENGASKSPKRAASPTKANGNTPPPEKKEGKKEAK